MSRNKMTLHSSSKTVTVQERLTFGVGGVQLKMLIDSGATSNVIDENTWERLESENIKCHSYVPKTERKLYSYGSSQPLSMKGAFTCEITIGSRTEQSSFCSERTSREETHTTDGHGHYWNCRRSNPMGKPSCYCAKSRWWYQTMLRHENSKQGDHQRTPSYSYCGWVTSGHEWLSHIQQARPEVGLPPARADPGVTTFAVHSGVYRFKRQIFGVSSTSEQYQHEIANALAGNEGVENISDDIIVHAHNQETHDTCHMLLPQYCKARDIWSSEFSHKP